MKKVAIGKKIKIDDFMMVVEGDAEVVIEDDIVERIKKSRNILEKKIKEGKIIYGVNTGFGGLSEIKIPEEDIITLQKNLIRSHCVGVGKPLPSKIVRGVMFLKAHNFALGYSGVRVELVKFIVDMINKGIYPVVPSKGSVGASGDLAPLAHIALGLIGEGDIEYRGKIINAMQALKKEGLEPFVFQAKEGLSFINGTQVMSAIGAYSIFESLNLADCADVSGSMTLEAIKGTQSAFDERIFKIKPYRGAIISAKNLRNLLHNSEIGESHKYCEKVQDAYSLRCIPQVHGAIRDVISFAKDVIETEMNSVSDNPLVFDDGEILSCGNFHGESVAISLDTLAVAVSELGNISERRIEHILNPSLSGGLPPFLAKKSGLNSGFMIVQVSSSSLVSENKVLCHPASVDSIPSSANKEDHVSMGMCSALKLLNVIENVKYILASELLCACQGIDFHKPLKPGKGVLEAYNIIRKEVPFIEDDVIVFKEIEKIKNLIDKRKFLISNILK